MSDYTVRRLRPEDAAGVAECFKQIYGDSYIHPEIYHPDQLVRLNETGALISVIAVAVSGQIVGHYALERPDLGSIAEGGEAIVLPEHRHHHVMEDMHALLETEAAALGLAGIFGQSVTNHVFTQKLHERFGLTPCAIGLGASPQSFHNMPEALPQRMSLLLGFKYLIPCEARTVFVPDGHRSICGDIYKRLGVPVTLGEPRPASGAGRFDTTVLEHKQSAFIRVDVVGADTVDEVIQAQALLTGRGMAVVFLDLPLAAPGMPAVAAALERAGFFFSGIAPHFLPSGDALRLQRLNCDIDTSLLQIADPFARELVAYVEHQRRQGA